MRLSTIIIGIVLGFWLLLAFADFFMDIARMIQKRIDKKHGKYTD